MNRIDDWIEYGKKVVLCTGFSYARYSKGMVKLTAFGMKNSVNLLSLGWTFFNSLKDEKDDSVYTYKVK